MVFVNKIFYKNCRKHSLQSINLYIPDQKETPILPQSQQKTVPLLLQLDL